MAITLDSVSSGYNLSAINDNFSLIQEAINNSIVWRTGSVSGETTMSRDLDMNSYAILNYKVDTSDNTSLITIGEADARYYKKDGDTLTGTMQVNGQSIIGAPNPTVSSQVANKQYVDNESSYRALADANLQSQLTGEVPLEASAFSEISWHGQEISNSVTIPANKNAWSFGPQMEIKDGQLVTISPGSTWTVADGRVIEDEDLHNLIADSISTSDGGYVVNVKKIANTDDVNELSESVSSLASRVSAEEEKVQPITLGGTGATTKENARNNLGLGGAAVLSVGTSSGTVAAGDDSRFAGRLLAVKKITSSQTYTPTTGMSYAIVYGIGAGGAGGGTVATSSSQVAVGTGGNSGVAAKVLLTASQIGTSQAITIGAGGVPVSGAAGGAGGDSIFGTLFTLKGGVGGYSSALTANTVVYSEAAGPAQPSAPTISTGTVLELIPSYIGGFGKMYSSTAIGGAGANSPQGSGGRSSGGAANPGVGKGSAGGGAGATVSTSAQAGGAGMDGFFLIYEYA